MQMHSVVPLCSTASPSRTVGEMKVSAGKVRSGLQDLQKKKNVLTHTDKSSLALTGTRLAALENVAQMASAVITTDLALGSYTNVGLATLAVVALRICVPALVSEFACR